MAKTLSYAQRATKYAKDIVSGKIRSCQYVRLACQRHLNDLEKAKAKDSQYVWDKDAGNNICLFAEQMVHIKGEWAGQKIKLEDWQCFVLAAPFGWKVRASGLRKYSEIYDEIPRKNSKSTIGAIIGLYMLCADNEPGAEVYSGATSEKQAMEVFRPAWLMCLKNKPFADYFGLELSGTIKNPGAIYRIKDGSRFEPVVHNVGDGASPQCGIVDEYHEHKDPNLYDTFATGMGSRRQGMQLVITTAGTDTSAPCYAKRQHAIEVLLGTRNDDSLFTIIYTIDESKDKDGNTDEAWLDFDNWIAANPNYGVSVYEHYLRKRYNTALENVGERNIILCKHLNKWSNAGVSAFDMAAWARNARAEIRLEDYEGCTAYAGLDLASRLDLACLVFLIDGPNYQVTFAKHYLPSATVDKAENASYRQYAADGWLTVTDGVRTDFSRIEADLKEIAEILDIQRLGFDPKEATYLMQSISEWAKFDLIEIIQGPAEMSEPMQELEADIAAGSIIHCEDPLYTWQMGNVVKKQGKTGGPVKYYYPTKTADALKIDAAVSLIMAKKMEMMEGEPTGDPGIFDWFTITQEAHA